MRPPAHEVLLGLRQAPDFEASSSWRRLSIPFFFLAEPAALHQAADLARHLPKNERVERVVLYGHLQAPLSWRFMITICARIPAEPSFDALEPDPGPGRVL